MQTVVSKSRLKPRLLAYLRAVEQSGQEIVITDRGRPVAKIVPCRESATEPLASLRNSVLRYDDPTAPLDPEDWEALR